MKSFASIVAVILAVLASDVQAQSGWIFGVAYDDLKDYRDPSVAISVDYEFGTIFDRPSLKWRVGSMVAGNGNLWIGAGVGVRRPLRRGPWFWEANLLAGPYYRKDEAPGIGNTHFPMFRTQFGIGRMVSQQSSVSLAFTHFSDAGLDEDAGSSEAIGVLYRIRY